MQRFFEPKQSRFSEPRQKKANTGLSLNSVPTWKDYSHNIPCPKNPHFPVNDDINSKVSLWKGDSTALKIDSIVNAANQSLLGGGGIDGIIHIKAGPKLRRYCQTLNGCKTGYTKKSPGFNLPCQYILHTVGPIGERPAELRSCYQTILEHIDGDTIRSTAFCGISTGIYGYPINNAVHIALKTVREWLENPENLEKVDRLVFVVFDHASVEAYHRFFPIYFPHCIDTNPVEDSDSQRDEEIVASCSSSDDLITQSSEESAEEVIEGGVEDRHEGEADCEQPVVEEKMESAEVDLVEDKTEQEADCEQPVVEEKMESAEVDLVEDKTEQEADCEQPVVEDQDEPTMMSDE
ncbi:hypothetical protein GEMRC1_012363 [Eukaryota sp. GEM-RC1]